MQFFKDTAVLISIFLVYCRGTVAKISESLASLRATLGATASDHLVPYWRFFYASFLKPHVLDSRNGQCDALEGFYSSQADAYDVTRVRLLKGREDMLSLAAAQLKFRDAGKPGLRDLIWVDVRCYYPN
jgi:hypothetical protein